MCLAVVRRKKVNCGRESVTLGSLDANLEAPGASIGQVVSSLPACLGGEEAGNLRAEV